MTAPLFVMLTPLIGETKGRIIELLRTSRSLTVDEIAEHLGTTASNVRQHMDDLVRAKLIEIEKRRCGPGRPRHFHTLKAVFASELKG